MAYKIKKKKRKEHFAESSFDYPEDIEREKLRKNKKESGWY